jgi:hypothetical protein
MAVYGRRTGTYSNICVRIVGATDPSNMGSQTQNTYVKLATTWANIPPLRAI